MAIFWCIFGVVAVLKIILMKNNRPVHRRQYMQSSNSFDTFITGTDSTSPLVAPVTYIDISESATDPNETGYGMSITNPSMVAPYGINGPSDSPDMSTGTGFDIFDTDFTAGFSDPFND
jgi:hypothetical protein